jgi:anaerobic magnesium-protoporphyrin IX monomethyl ester cyclase
MGKRINKIMLIVPPITRDKDFSAKVSRVTDFFPLGMAYIAATLEKTGLYKLKILDSLKGKDLQEGIVIDNGDSIRYGLTDNELEYEIKKFSPDVIGVSCLFSGAQWDAANVCSIIKKISSEIFTIMGGAHAGNMAQELLHLCKEIDYVIVGEAENAFVQILDAIDKNEDVSQIDGIGYRENETVRLNKKTEYVRNLDSIPFPAYHLFDMQIYLNDADSHGFYRYPPYTQMITSRGCPCKCTFCALGSHWGPKQRLRSASNILDEMEFLIQQYGIREIHFEDDNLTANRKRALELFDGMIERKLNLHWHAPSGMAVYTLTEDIIEKMAEAGCYSVTLAIESGNQEVLSKMMRKPVDLNIVPALVKKIREVGMDVRGFFMLGFPGETKENINQTVEFACSLELDWAYFSIFSPLPKTAMYDLCLEKGYIKKSDFDPMRSFHRSIVRTPEFDPDYLNNVREKAIIKTCFKNNPNLLRYDIDKAIDNFESVVRRYPHFDFANFYLAEAYLRKGKKSKAVKSYKKTLLINPLYIEAETKLNELLR